MSEFVNTISVLGDDAVMDSIIERTITEFKDNMITEIGHYAFYGCADLETVDLPAVTIVRNSSFEDCAALNSISLPNVEKIIGSKAFMRCVSLRYLNLPKAYDFNAQNVFNGCTSLDTIILPAATALYTNAFVNCNSLRIMDFTSITKLQVGIPSAVLESLIIRNKDSVCSLSGTITAAESGTAFIYVPSALVDSYKAATNWSAYAAQFRALEDYTVDGTIGGALDESKI